MLTLSLVLTQALLLFLGPSKYLLFWFSFHVDVIKFDECIIYMGLVMPFMTFR